jgi:Na+-transporting methylmalonyl-CoA/oxaloacetate decarboxylase gamma subunit
MNVQDMIVQAFKLMGVGVGMVFAVLAIFYGLVRALMFIFPAKHEDSND